jgi:hypothetical protein
LTAPALDWKRGPVLRRPMNLAPRAKKLRAQLTADFDTIGRRVVRELARGGVLSRLHTDATHRLATKQAVGRGGGPLGPTRSRELEEVFDFDDFRLVANLTDDLEDAFRLELEGTLAEAYPELFEVGGTAARRALGVRGSFNLRSPAVADALLERANQLSGNVAADVFERLKTVIAEEFYFQGRGPFEVAKSLTEEFDWLSQSRAELIARTETGAVVEEGQWLTYYVTGVPFKRWLTTLDGREREDHFEAHGQIREIDEPFDVGGEQLMHPLDPAGSAKQVCNCFPGFVQVSGRVEAGLRVEYVGPMLEVTTARTGRRLTVTPQHPVLTERGFIPACELRQGDNLACYSTVSERQVARFGVVDYEHDQPASIEDVFNALRFAGDLRAREVLVDDLHGDARFAQGQIDVVSTDGVLVRHVFAEQLQGSGHLDLMLTNIEQAHAPGYSTSGATLHGIDPAPAPNPGPAALALDSTTVQLHGGPLQYLRVGPAANLDATRFEPANKNGAGNAVLLANLFERGAGQVFFDPVAEVRQFEFSGHVYDLQSPLGWIVAQGIVCSNCRCTEIPVLSAEQALSDADVWDGANDPAEFARDQRRDPDLPPGIRPPPPSEVDDLDFQLPEDEKRYAEVVEIRDPTQVVASHPFGEWFARHFGPGPAQSEDE